MAKRDYTLASKLLITLAAAIDASEYVFGTPSSTLRKLHRMSPDTYYRLIRRWKRKGWIRVVDKNNERFIKITREGQLEALFLKARINTHGKWDGKWRIIVFDIPEESKHKRVALRSLLKVNHFKLLQQSVYISPYPLHRDALAYLKVTRLINYIRIIKAEEIDDDSDLRKKFKLDTK